MGPYDSVTQTMLAVRWGRNRWEMSLRRPADAASYGAERGPTALLGEMFT